jgi:hypothetical protein
LLTRLYIKEGAIKIEKDLNQELALKRLRSNPDFQMLREMIEQEKIRPIENQLLEKPLSDFAEVRYLQGLREGLMAVFKYLEFLTREKQKQEKDV